MKLNVEAMTMEGQSKTAMKMGCNKGCKLMANSDDDVTFDALSVLKGIAEKITQTEAM